MLHDRSSNGVYCGFIVFGVHKDGLRDPMGNLFIDEAIINRSKEALRERGIRISRVSRRYCYQGRGQGSPAGDEALRGYRWSHSLLRDLGLGSSPHCSRPRLFPDRQGNPALDPSWVAGLAHRRGTGYARGHDGGRHSSQICLRFC